MSEDRKIKVATRLADTQRRALQLVTVKPNPPRGVKYSGGTVTWELPAEMRNVTHFRVYINREGNLERSVSAPQTQATAVYGDRVFVSSYNQQSGLESRKVPARVVTTRSGPAGEELLPIVTSFTAEVVDSFSGDKFVSESGAQLFRIQGEIGIPESAVYGGCRIVAKVDSEPGYVLIADLEKDQEEFISGIFPIAKEEQTWTLYAVSKHTNGQLNTIVDGTTPKVILEIEVDTVGTLDIARALSTSYDTIEFEIVGGAFKVKAINLTKAFNFNLAEFEISAGAFKVKELAADKIRTGILSIGNPAGGMVSKAAGFSTAGVPYFFIGDDTAGSGFQGGWFWEFRVGGTDPGTAKFIATNAGDVSLKGASIYVGPGTTGEGGQFFIFNKTAITGWMGTGDGPFPTLTITTSVANLYTTSTVHGYTVGEFVKIAGNTNGPANGVKEIASTPTTSSFITTEPVSGSGTGGTVIKQISGAWFRDIRLGGSGPSTSTVTIDSTSAIFRDIEIEIFAGTSTVFLNPTDGLRIVSATYEATLTSGYLAIENPSVIGRFSEYRDVSWLIQYDNTTGGRIDAIASSGSAGFLVKVAGVTYTSISDSGISTPSLNLTSSPLGLASGGTSATNAADARTALDVYSKAEIATLLAGKSNVGHTHTVTGSITATTVSSVPSSHGHPFALSAV